MPGYKLQDYCKVYNVESKLDNSYIEMNDVFKTYNSDITQYLKYGMQDTLIL